MTALAMFSRQLLPGNPVLAVDSTICQYLGEALGTTGTAVALRDLREEIGSDHLGCHRQPPSARTAGRGDTRARSHRGSHRRIASFLRVWTSTSTDSLKLTTIIINVVGARTPEVAMPNHQTLPATALDAAYDGDGFVAVLATDPQRSPAVLAELRAVVAGSAGGVLIVLLESTPWPGGAVVGVAPGRGSDIVGPPLWLGPLIEAPEQEALLGWLRDGGPGAAPMPKGLAGFALRPKYPAPRPHTAN